MELDAIVEFSESFGVQEIVSEFAKMGLINVDVDSDFDELFQCLLCEHLDELSEYVSSLINTVPTLLD